MQFHLNVTEKVFFAIGCKSKWNKFEIIQSRKPNNIKRKLQFISLINVADVNESRLSKIEDAVKKNELSSNTLGSKIALCSVVFVYTKSTMKP